MAKTLKLDQITECRKILSTIAIMMVSHLKEAGHPADALKIDLALTTSIKVLTQVAEREKVKRHDDH